MAEPPGSGAEHVVPLVLVTLGGTGLYAADGHRLMLSPGKPLALLTYLALTAGRRTSREFLMDLLWADLEPQRARSALRQALFHLRRLLGEDALPGTEELTLARPIDADRDRFLAAINEGDLEAALSAYAGEFLPTFGVPGGAAFEQWADLERTRLRAAFVRSADLVVRRHLNHSRFREAQRLARRIREEAPGEESAWRLLLETVIAGRDFVSAAVEASALEQWAASESLVLEPATRRLIDRARQVTPVGNEAGEGLALVAELTGRGREFSAITGAWDAAKVGPARHLHLKAPAGLGKTRLIQDAVARLQAAGTRVVVLRGAPGDREIPYAFAGDLAAALADLPGAAGVAPGSAATLLALNPALSSRLAGAPDTATGQDAMHRRVQALADLIHAAAEERALVLVIDDLHWIDLASYRVLEGLFGRFAGARVLCLTAARPDRVPAGDGVTVLPLAPLTETQVASLVSALGAIPEDLPWGQEFASGMHRATGGSPLLILETLRLAMDERIVDLDQGEWRCLDEGRLASLLQAGQALRQRVHALPPEQGWVLGLLATAGTPLPPDQLATAARRAPAEVAETLVALERQGLVSRMGHEWLPAHDEIAAAGRDLLDPTRQIDAARAIGHLLVDTAGEDPHRLLRGLRHYTAAGDMRQVHRHFPGYARLVRRQRDRRPFAALAAEVLGEDLTAPRVIALAGTVPLPWRIGLWTPVRQGVALAILVLTAALGGAAVMARQSRASTLQRLAYVDGTGTVRMVSILPGSFDGRDVALAPGRRGTVMAEAALAHPERPPATSPDGRSFAWTQDSGDSTTLDIWVRTPAGARRLTRESRDDVVNQWLPDGSGLIGMTNRWSSRSTGGYDIAVFDTATGAARPVTSGPDHEGSPFVSPDGTRVAFIRERVDGLTLLCVTAFDGEDPPECRQPAGHPMAQLLGWNGPVELVITLDSVGMRPLVRYDWERAEVTPLMGPYAYQAQLSPDRRWVAAAVRREGIPGFRDWVIPLDRPNQARRVEGPSGVAGVRWWEGSSDRSGMIDRIEFSDSTRTLLPGLGTRLAIRALTEAGTEVPVYAPIRWSSGDTLVATVDSLGDVRPRTTGSVTIEASLAGWRTVSRHLEVGGAPVRIVIEEQWDDGWPERWTTFGDPAPIVTTGPEMVRGFWNRGDGTYQSMAFLPQGFSARQGLGVEIRLSTPVTGAVWQRARIGLTAGLDTAAYRGADQQKAPPSLGRLDATCGIGYPGGAGEHGVTHLGVAGGLATLLDIGPLAAPLRSGQWWTLRLQILPDGRCGIAINRRVIWLSPEPIPLDGEFRLRLGDESAGLKLLHGPLQIWTGVRTDIDWSRQ